MSHSIAMISVIQIQRSFSQLVSVMRWWHWTRHKGIRFGWSVVRIEGSFSQLYEPVDRGGDLLSFWLYIVQTKLGELKFAIAYLFSDVFIVCAKRGQSFESTLERSATSKLNHLLDFVIAQGRSKFIIRPNYLVPLPKYPVIQPIKPQDAGQNLSSFPRMQDKTSPPSPGCRTKLLLLPQDAGQNFSSFPISWHWGMQPDRCDCDADVRAKNIAPWRTPMVHPTIFPHRPPL